MNFYTKIKSGTAAFKFSNITLSYGIVFEPLTDKRTF